MDEKNGQTDKEIKQKKKHPGCFSIGCITLLLFITAFVVWTFASPDQPDSNERDIAPTPSTTPIQSTTETKQSTAQPSTKTKQPTVKSPPKITTNCKGNFVPPNSAKLSVNTDNPGIKKNIDTHYYTIYGNTANDIKEGIHKCGPSVNGNNYAAFTRYNINPVYKTYPASSGCRVENVAVGVQIDLYYPKWKATKDAEAGLNDQWKAYYKQVERHENVHKEDVMDTAKDIQKYLNSLSNAPCNSITSEIQRYYDRLKVKSEKFDAKEYPKVKDWW